MKHSRAYKRGNRTFWYDYDSAVVSYVVKLSKKDIRENEQWKLAHNGRGLFYEVDGYEVVDSVGLMVENWKNKEVRDEHLDGWNAELDDLGAYMEKQCEKEFGYEIYG